jgi:glycosyltransferase involved in cell wall biosynthesis
VEDRHLHIVCLDTPYPVDYGGVFDLFHKIVTLHAAGIKIHLHCFEYGRGEQPELNKYCTEVTYYHRHEGHKGFSHKLPYIVCSRSNGQLLENLLKDEYPILLEGVHCTYLLGDGRFTGRKIILRLHNVEFQYYRRLYQSSASLLRKIYYLHESKMLKNYEKSIANKALILAVSDKDGALYRDEFGGKNVFTLPVFLPFEEVTGKDGTGCFCLYHGNLSVVENEQAVAWLLKEVFKGLTLSLVISGKNPSARLSRLIHQYPQACLIANPSAEEMQDLIAKAQINILPSFNNTGVKLKLLNALFNGRHCVVNRETVESTGLEEACHIGTDPEDFRKLIDRLYRQPFTRDEILSRKMLLARHFNNEENGKRLIQWIW